ncbi:hypothetical protein KXV85_005785, partial [Aspergillus fumigatus]
VEEAVLFGKARDFGFGMLQDQAVPVEAAGVRDVERAIVPGGDAGGDLHAVVVDVGAGPVLGRALQLADVLHVGRAAGRDHRRLEPMRANAGQRLVVEFLRLGPTGLGRVQHEAAELQAFRPGDLARQRDRFRWFFDPGTLAA